MLSYYTLATLTASIYFHTFFPISQNVITKHELPTKLKDINFNLNEIYNSSVDKIILIVIDALRYDFINQNNVPNLIEFIEKDGCLSLVEVEAPTVTLPRIKALTTGNVPQFIDLLLNVIGTQTITDSILHQAVYNGKKIVFFGDDTWLKLYPDMFLRYEGTSSFFVYDYTEVDDNVTRNLDKELTNNDWDIMILHYLGLDHIGHIAGPYSKLIKPKLQEMDNIIKKIYDSTKHQKRLVIITGDHGMKDSGGHGGKTYSETRVPLAILGEKCLNDTFTQTDIPMILSTYLGLPFPSSSIGKISTKSLSSFDLDKLLYILHYNSLYLHNKTNICRDMLEKASEMHYNYLKSRNISYSELAISSYEFCLNEMNSDLVNSSIEQDDAKLIFCIVILLYSLIKIALNMLNCDKETFEIQELIIFIFIITSYYYKLNHYLIIAVTVLLTLLILKLFIYFVNIVIKLKYNKKSDLILIGFNILHSISMLSSSFIEEEHQTWYFFFVTFLIVNNTKNYDSYSLITLIFFRILRKLNQTGDKWAAEPDLKQWLLASEHYFYYITLYATSIVLISILTTKYFSKNIINNFFTVFTLILIFILKIFDPKNVLLAQFIWFLILVSFLSKPSLKSLIKTWILIISLLYRPQNLILVPFCVYTSLILSKRVTSNLSLIILHLWLGNVLYFCQGNSNSIGSIDVGAGYVGLNHYEPFLVFLQLTIHTYSMPILANLLLILNDNNLKIWDVIGLFRLLNLTIIIVLSFIQRYHLFIWSVFAPKIMYEISHTLILLCQMLLHHLTILLNTKLKS